VSIIFYTLNLNFRDGILPLNASIYTKKFNQIIFLIIETFHFLILLTFELYLNQPKIISDRFLQIRF
tara:strand:+ start:6701 stop:6901 length:201 start_codon:yes stop_codon:yes gene_type:complete